MVLFFEADSRRSPVSRTTGQLFLCDSSFGFWKMPAFVSQWRSTYFVPFLL